MSDDITRCIDIVEHSHYALARDARAALAELVERAEQNIGLGYTLASGKLYCDMPLFHAYAEHLLDRPILTHEFASEDLWTELRIAFEVRAVTAAALSSPEPDG